MPVSSQTLIDTKARIAIEEVIGDFVRLKKRGSGSTYWGCCPFHNERTPSFAVNAEKGFYKCFGCGKGGDAIAFLEQKEGMTYLESMRYLADRYGVVWEEEKGGVGHKKEKDDRERLHLLIDFAADYYQEQLTQNRDAEAYLAKRGISRALASQFKIGYSTTAWQGFHRYATGKGYGEEALEEVGLLVRKGERVYDRLRGRITFLLSNANGQAVGIAGRILVPSGEEPKYINPPETKVYQKSDYLYGLYQAKKAIREEQNCYLVEGYTDVLALHRAGVGAVVASSGTSLTAGQVGLLKRFTGKVTLLFDGDEAGQRAALRGIDILLRLGMEVKVVLLPAGEDPDTYLHAHGKEAFRAYLREQAQDFVTFQMYQLLEGVRNDPVKKGDAFQRIMESLALIPDAVRRGVYMEIASKLTGLSLPIVEEAVRNLRGKSVGREVRVERKVGLVAKRDGEKNSEEVFIYLLLHYGQRKMRDGRQLVDYLLEELEDVPFRSDWAQDIFGRFLTAWREDKEVTGEGFIKGLPVELREKVVHIMADRHELSGSWWKRHHIFTRQVEEVLDELVERNLLERKMNFVQELLREQRLLMAQARDAATVDGYLMRHGDIKELDIEIRQRLGVPILPPLPLSASYSHGKGDEKGAK